MNEDRDYILEEDTKQSARKAILLGRSPLAFSNFVKLR